MKVFKSVHWTATLSGEPNLLNHEGQVLMELLTERIGDGPGWKSLSPHLFDIIGSIVGAVGTQSSISKCTCNSPYSSR